VIRLYANVIKKPGQKTVITGKRANIKIEQRESAERRHGGNLTERGKPKGKPML
jgi:hypothetical protein